jgi:hypothetical protein
MREECRDRDGRDEMRGREEVGEGDECIVRRLSDGKRGMGQGTGEG